MRSSKISPPGFMRNGLAKAVLLVGLFLGGCLPPSPDLSPAPKASATPWASESPSPLPPLPFSPTPLPPISLSPTPFSPSTSTPTFAPQITPSPWRFELLFGPWDQVGALAWSADGNLLAVSAGNQVYILDGITFQPQQTLQVGSWSDDLVFAPLHGSSFPSLLAVAVKDGKVQLWDASSGKQLAAWTAHQKGAKSVAIHPGGAWLASTGGDAMLRLWDIQALIAQQAQEPSPLAEMIGGAYAIPDACFSPDGSLVASVDVKNIRLRDPATQRLVRTLRGDASIFQIAFNPAGSWLAAAEMGNTVSLWDVAVGQPAAGLPIARWSASSGQAGEAKTFLWGLAFSPEGSRLAAGGSDGMVTLWSTETGQVLQRFRAHNRAVTSLVFSPDGKLLASGGLDSALRIWDR